MASWYYAIYYLTYCILISLSHGIPLNGKNVRDSKENELPFVASIGLKGRPDRHFCTGTLITQQSILTAAHCIMFGNQLENIEAFIGSHDLRKAKGYRPKSWISFNQWLNETDDDDRTSDDISVMTLDEKVDGIRPASILTFAPECLYKSKVRIAGWGDYDNGTQPMILKTAVLTVISNKECGLKIEKILKKDVPYFPKQLFCSLANPWVLGTCGDSGAPILNKQNQLVGIHKGICPSPQTLSDHDNFTNSNLVNLHLHLYYYRGFIKYMKQ